MYLHKSQLLFWGSLFFLSGAGQMSRTVIIIASLGIGVWYCVYEHVAIWSVLLFLCITGGAWWLGWQQYATYIPNTEQIPYEKTIEFSGTVVVPPRNTNDKQKIYLSSTVVTGLMYVKTFSYPQYHYGDVIQVRCALTRPQPFNDFAYDRYLARYGVYVICENAQLRLLHSTQGNIVYYYLYRWRDAILAQVRKLWPEPVAGIISGILLGFQDDLFADVNAAFRTTGTVHILVVSGMHVVIIANIISTTLQRWCSRKQVFIITGLSLAMFAIITGLAASVIRAGLMGLLPLLAQLFGRKRVEHYGLAFVAAGIVAYNPYILLHDVGFQLSFLATIGIIYFQSFAQRCCRWVPSWFQLRETLSTTLAAMITTTPLIVQIFGTFSLVAPLANIVVVPVSNVILFGSAGILLVNIVWSGLAQYAAFVLWKIISWLLVYVRYLADWPQASVANIIFPAYVFQVSFLSISAIIAWSIRKKSAI